MGKVIVDSISVMPNPVNTKNLITIEIILHEEYEDEKKYPYKYPVRFGGE